MTLCLIVEPDERIVCERPLAKAIIKQLDVAANNETLFVCVLVKLNAFSCAKRNRIAARNKTVWSPMIKIAHIAPRKTTKNKLFS